jgi:hypothetical protein
MSINEPKGLGRVPIRTEADDIRTLFDVTDRQTLVQTADDGREPQPMQPIAVTARPLAHHAVAFGSRHRHRRRVAVSDGRSTPEHMDALNARSPDFLQFNEHDEKTVHWGQSSKITKKPV